MIIVAGITRSGLSVTMQMLDAGGFPCVGEFPAYEEYPEGTIPWESCQGKAVKLVDAHRQFPPPGQYRIIRLHRNAMEQAKSINKWNNAFGLPSVSESRLAHSCWRDYKLIDEWADPQSHLSLNFEEIINEPTTAALRICAFVGRELDIPRMAAAVRPRKATCHPTLLELELLGLPNR